MKKVLLVLVSMFIVISLTSCGGEKDGEKGNIGNSEEENVVNKINEEVQPDFVDIGQKVASGELTEEEAQAAMMDSINSSDTVQTQFEKSKEQMPKILEILKANKKCIESANSKNDAEECQEEAIELAKKLGISEIYEEDEDEDEDFEWSDEIKEETLVDLEEGIDEFEKMLPCVEKAETLTDMMQCGSE